MREKSWAFVPVLLLNLLGSGSAVERGGARGGEQRSSEAGGEVVASNGEADAVRQRVALVHRCEHGDGSTTVDHEACRGAMVVQREHL